jgi:hypothetical protein
MCKIGSPQICQQEKENGLSFSRIDLPFYETKRQYVCSQHVYRTAHRILPTLQTAPFSGTAGTFDATFESFEKVSRP